MAIAPLIMTIEVDIELYAQAISGPISEMLRARTEQEHRELFEGYWNQCVGEIVVGPACTSMKELPKTEHDWVARYAGAGIAFCTPSRRLLTNHNSPRLVEEWVEEPIPAPDWPRPAYVPEEIEV